MLCDAGTAAAAQRQCLCTCPSSTLRVRPAPLLSTPLARPSPSSRRCTASVVLPPNLVYSPLCKFAESNLFFSGNKLAKHLGSNGCMSAYPSKEEAQKAKLVVEGEEDEAMEEEAEEGGDKDEQQKHEEEEAFKKQCKTSPKKVEKEPSPKKLAEKEENRSGSEAVEEAEEKGPTSEAKDKIGEGEKGDEDEESPKTGGMLLFGTLFKYMDKDKEDGVEKNTELETSKAKTDEGNDRKVDSAESAPMEEEERSKAGEKEEPDLTTPPPPQEEMDTASVPPSI